jgi:hypothetical protein
MVHPNKKTKLKLDPDRIAALEALGFSWSNDASFDLEKHKAYFAKKPKVQAKSKSSVPIDTEENQLMVSVPAPNISSAIEGSYPKNWGAV